MIKDIIRISKDLLYEQPFYGSVLLSLLKEIDSKIPTACVGLNGIMYKLKVNETFWKELSDDHKKGLLIHELGHIINFHLTDYKHLKNHEIANQAMDIYINQKIPANLLPDGGCTWDKYENLQADMSTNWYYEKLMKNDEKQNDETLKNQLSAMGGGDGECKDKDGNPMQVPAHDWEEVTEAPEAIQKMLDKNTQVMLADIVKNSDPGNVPGGLKELLEEKANIEPPKFNWRAFMKRFVGTSTKTWVQRTRRKKSRRFAGMPGSREQYFSHILVGIDTSASVNKEELKEFYNELVHMNKTGHDITIVQCDTKIQGKPYKFNPRKPFEIEGRGGTRFAPVVDLYEKNLKKYSCLIYLTDGEAYDVTTAKGQILWCHSSISDINENLPGRKIKLN
jgi:predicted metal-dependent peptidase